MMSDQRNRRVSHILYAEEVDMGGMLVRQPLPTQNVSAIDPFLLLHYASLEVPPDVNPKHAGVGPHPHRGFSPVTFVFAGAVHHRDSRGNSSIVHAGGTQWMNAGMGIVHSERPAANILDLGGRQEIIQLWINTPMAHKMDQPAYHPLTADETPTIVTDDGKVEISVVAGEFEGTAGPIPSQTDVTALRANFSQGGQHYFELPPSHNAFLFALDGQLRIEGHGVMDGLNLALLQPGAKGIGVEALADTRFILMSGEPLNEPVVNYGPFVMTSTTEVMEAMRDYQMGKMGILIEDD